MAKAFLRVHAMGHGVGLGDYAIDWVIIPYQEFGMFHLEKEYV